MAPLALRILRFFPAGFSQPEWIRHRFESRTHTLYLVPFFWYQLMAVTAQLCAGGSIFAVLTGARVESVMIVLAATTLGYGIISGMRASIVTDFLQYALIVAGGGRPQAQRGGHESGHPAGKGCGIFGPVKDSEALAARPAFP